MARVAALDARLTELLTALRLAAASAHAHGDGDSVRLAHALRYLTVEHPRYIASKVELTLLTWCRNYNFWPPRPPRGIHGKLMTALSSQLIIRQIRSRNKNQKQIINVELGDIRLKVSTLVGYV